MLHLRDLKKTFRQPDGTIVEVLDIDDYQVDAGEQVVMVGESGCGKTTLLHIIAGISRPDSGKVRVADWELTLLPEAECDSFRAEHIGYVFQTFNLLPGFSALENVLLGMTFARGRKDPPRAQMLLDRVGLTARASHNPSALSVGEQQRVAVARALANRPALILADEPTANVDHAHQSQIVELIRETCREENIGLLMVTHSQEVASQFERVDRLEEINRV